MTQKPSCSPLNSSQKLKNSQLLPHKQNKQKNSPLYMAWRRFVSKKLTRVMLAVVLLYVLLFALSLLGAFGCYGDAPVAINYAPPTLFAHSTNTAQAEALSAPQNGCIANGAVQTVELYGTTDPIANSYHNAMQQACRQANVDTTKNTLASTLPFGADMWGHNVLSKTIQGGVTSVFIGLMAAFLAVGLGTLLGALSGYFGKKVDAAIMWLYNVFTAMPEILLILAIAAVLNQRGVATIIIILGLTGWTGTYRLIRAEYMKHRGREYVLAARSMGAGTARLMFVHILPNVSHIVLVQLSLLAVGCIKAEVILSFLGFGVPVGTISWGRILNETPDELVQGIWWQLAVVTVVMGVFVTAFSVLTDALRDALDPKQT